MRADMLCTGYKGCLVIYSLKDRITVHLQSRSGEAANFIFVFHDENCLGAASDVTGSGSDQGPRRGVTGLWKIYFECSANPRFAVDIYIAIALFDDPIDGREPKARAAS